MDPEATHDAAARLATAALGDPRTARLDGLERPGKAAISELVGRLFGLLYPGFFDFRPVAKDAATLTPLIEAETRAVAKALAALACQAIRHTNAMLGEPADSRVPAGGEDTAACTIADRFVAQLPAVRHDLSLDVQAAADGDPSCRSTDEAVLCLGGVHAVTVHRLAHALDRAGCPLLPRMMADLSKTRTGVDIHPHAHVGKSFFIDHGVGVVIGETAIIGDHCKIYQGVTLGARSLPSDDNGRVERQEQRHPTLEDHVTVYAGATILGGDTVIGAGSVIGGGVFITESVPPGKLVLGPKPETNLRGGTSRPPSNFQI